jgi:hypothetical protein
MSFADDLAAAERDPRKTCMFSDWLLTLDSDLADEIDQKTLAPGANVSAIFRTIRTPKYGFKGSIATVNRHARLQCSCGES